MFVKSRLEPMTIHMIVYTTNQSVFASAKGLTKYNKNIGCVRAEISPKAVN